MRFFTFLFIYLVVPVFAHVIQTDSLEPLKSSIPDLNSQDLVIFDYDRTLFMPKDALLQFSGKKCLHIRIHEKAPDLTQEKIKELISLVLLSRKTILLDPDSLEIVQTLQDKGIKVFVLTALRTGTFGKIPKTEEWRLQELYENGFNFSISFPQITRIDFKKYPNQKNHPVYLEGLFCSGSWSKGKALYCFLKKTRFHPHRIIFIDNAADHHKSVEKLARHLKIPYLGYYYTAALKMRKNVDEEIANFQIEYLIENEKWLNDEEAEIAWKNTPI